MLPITRIIYPDDFDGCNSIWIINDWDFKILVGEFGTHKSRQQFENENFPNSLVHPELNCRGIGWVKN